MKKLSVFFSLLAMLSLGFTSCSSLENTDEDIATGKVKYTFTGNFSDDATSTRMALDISQAGKIFHWQAGDKLVFWGSGTTAVGSYTIQASDIDASNANKASFSVLLDGTPTTVVATSNGDDDTGSSTMIDVKGSNETYDASSTAEQVITGLPILAEAAVTTSSTGTTTATGSFTLGHKLAYVYVQGVSIGGTAKTSGYKVSTTAAGTYSIAKDGTVKAPSTSTSATSGEAYHKVFAIVPGMQFNVSVNNNGTDASVLSYASNTLTAGNFYKVNAARYTVTYHDPFNNASIVDPTLYKAGESVSIHDNTFTEPTSSDGYVIFGGWNTAANQSGTTFYPASSTYPNVLYSTGSALATTMTVNGNVDLYATYNIWAKGNLMSDYSFASNQYTGEGVYFSPSSTTDYCTKSTADNGNWVMPSVDQLKSLLVKCVNTAYPGQTNRYGLFCNTTTANTNCLFLYWAGFQTTSYQSSSYYRYQGMYLSSQKPYLLGCYETFRGVYQENTSGNSVRCVKKILP